MSKDCNYIKGLEDLAGNPYDIFRWQNPLPQNRKRWF